MKKLTKAIILAGGLGSRLYPLTFAVSKHLLPVYDKPMIYYPLSTIINAGINDILIITTKFDLPQFKRLLGNGEIFGVNISYEIQLNPNGIAESIIIGSDFIDNDDVMLILGDNIFYGENFNFYLNKAKFNLSKGFSTILGVDVENPEDFGVINFDKKNKIKSIIEKPTNTKSNTIVSGLYFYTNNVIDLVKDLQPSKRGELEITDLNNMFLSQNKLKHLKLDSTISWVDTGTYSSLIRASQLFQTIEKNTQKKICCIEEICFRKGYINRSQLLSIANSMKNSDYGKYLYKILSNESD